MAGPSCIERAQHRTAKLGFEATFWNHASGFCDTGWIFILFHTCLGIEQDHHDTLLTYFDILDWLWVPADLQSIHQVKAWNHVKHALSLSMSRQIQQGHHAKAQHWWRRAARQGVKARLPLVARMLGLAHMAFYCSRLLLSSICLSKWAALQVTPWVKDLMHIMNVKIWFLHHFARRRLTIWAFPFWSRDPPRVVCAGYVALPPWVIRMLKPCWAVAWVSIRPASLEEKQLFGVLSKTWQNAHTVTRHASCWWSWYWKCTV